MTISADYLLVKVQKPNPNAVTVRNRGHSTESQGFGFVIDVLFKGFGRGNPFIMAMSLLYHFGCLLLVCTLSSLMCACQCACPSKCVCDLQHHLVKCPEGELEQIPWDLPDPPGLLQLDLSGNHIFSIISEIVSYSNLELLDLSDNQLLNIDGHVLDALPRLKYLNLHNNRLSVVRNDTFAGLASLVKLDLSNNNINQLPDGVFNDLVSLEELDLSANELMDVLAATFTGLAGLRRLVLANNQFSVLPVNALSQFPNLNFLSLHTNNLKSLPQDAFKALSDLRHLILASNRLSDLPASAFHNNHVSFVPQLEIIDLQNNRLTQVPSLIFTLLRHLQEVFLSQNPISVIDPDAFRASDLVRLNKVHLNSMPSLEIIRKFSFSELRDLHVVEMHSNYKLREIEKDAFIGSNSIQEVDFHANALKSLDINLLDWGNLHKLDLRFNPWLCDCNLLWIKEALFSIHGNSSHDYIHSHVTCSEPPSLSESSVLDVPDNKFVCGKVEQAPPRGQFEDSIMIGIFASTACILLLIGGILFFKYRTAMFESPPETMDYQVYHNNCRASRDRLVSNGSAASCSSRAMSPSRQGITSRMHMHMEDYPTPKRKPGRKLRQVRFSDDIEEPKEGENLTSAQQD